MLSSEATIFFVIIRLQFKPKHWSNHEYTAQMKINKPQLTSHNNYIMTSKKQ